MLKAFQQHITTTFPFLEQHKILIAISGGIDSVVLTHLLHTLKFNIALAHCNFKLRNLESDTDEAFVKTLAKELEIPCFSTSFETTKFAKQNGISTQMAARNLRYNWFHKTLENEHYNTIVTAHHANDSLETVLLNLSRGTGLDGLLGIPKQNNNTIRPMLPFSRKQIEAYAKKQQILWREDASNASEKYKRNKIRHQVVPVLKTLNPSLLDSFLKTISYLENSQSLVKDAVNMVSKEILSETNNTISINIEKLKKHKNYKAYLYEILKPYQFTAWSDVNDLLNAQSGKFIDSATHRLLKDRSVLVLSQKIEKNVFNIPISENDRTILFPFGTLRLEKSDKAIDSESHIVYLDKNLLKFPLHVRTWQKGDYFYPLGMQGKKKLSKFFKDEKYSLLEKEKAWLLCNADNTIIWIGGKRLDNRFKITNKTTNTLKISFLNT